MTERSGWRARLIPQADRTIVGTDAYKVEDFRIGGGYEVDGAGLTPCAIIALEVTNTRDEREHITLDLDKGTAADLAAALTAALPHLDRL